MATPTTPMPPDQSCGGVGGVTIKRYVTTIIYYRSIRKKEKPVTFKEKDASGKSKAVTILRKDGANF